jgi:hypothetical protein
VRNAQIQEEFAKRCEAVQDTLATTLERIAAQLGLQLRFPAPVLAQAVGAALNGLAFERASSATSRCRPLAGRRAVRGPRSFDGGIRRCIGASLAQAEMAEVIRTVVTRADLWTRDQSPASHAPPLVESSRPVVGVAQLVELLVVVCATHHHRSAGFAGIS